jgi:hypothetical protein
MEIPAFADNLERLDQHKANASVVKGKQSKPIPEPPKPVIQYKILTGKGLLIAFLPILQADGSVKSFDAFLINDTPYDVIFEFEWLLHDNIIHSINKKLNTASTFSLCNILNQDLSDSPNLKINCWRITTQGTDPKLSQTLRVKPKTFFNKLTTAPLLNQQAYVFTVFSSLENTKKDTPTKKEDDLRTYTLKNAAPLKPAQPAHYVPIHDLKAYAEFVPEIDLHIEKLVADYSKMDNAAILKVQFKHFEAFLNKAIRLGLPRVFVIHGIGKGTLKDTIASYLIQHPDVVTFKNEYHHKYGWGATEVVLN